MISDPDFSHVGPLGFFSRAMKVNRPSGGEIPPFPLSSAHERNTVYFLSTVYSVFSYSINHGEKQKEGKESGAVCVRGEKRPRRKHTGILIM